MVTEVLAALVVVLVMVLHPQLLELLVRVIMEVQQPLEAVARMLLVAVAVLVQLEETHLEVLLVQVVLVPHRPLQVLQ
jgi:hypothetical protein